MNARADDFTRTRYFSSLPDIPLMPGMTEITDADVVFDKAEGRIVQESAKAPNLNADQVISFYQAALPPLGWMPVKSASSGNSTTRFFRNGEQLIVNLDKLGSEGLVRFAVSPNRP